jgi:hypothetical protein
MSIDDAGDFGDFDAKDAEIEARFQDLEQEAELEKLRRMQGLDDTSTSPRSSAAKRSPSASADPLSDLKAALGEDDAEQPAGEGKKKREKAKKQEEGQYVLLLCPACNAKNRTKLEKLRKQLPVCGGCKETLSFG